MNATGAQARRHAGRQARRDECRNTGMPECRQIHSRVHAHVCTESPRNRQGTCTHVCLHVLYTCLVFTCLCTHDCYTCPYARPSTRRFTCTYTYSCTCSQSHPCPNWYPHPYTCACAYPRTNLLTACLDFFEPRTHAHAHTHARMDLATALPARLVFEPGVLHPLEALSCLVRHQVLARNHALQNVSISGNVCKCL